MQEKFALRKTLRKVAAVGTSLAMVGITVSGALAAGLSDYPGTLGFNKTPGQTVVVYGADADMGAAQDVVSGLPGGAATPVPAADEDSEQATGVLAYGVVNLGTLSVEDLFDEGEMQDVDLTDAINETDNFGNSLEDTDLPFLKDTSISLSMHDVSDDYDFHEEVRLGGNNNIDKQITVETGLTYGANRHEDWKDNVFLAMPTNSLGYYYVFDEDLKDGNFIANSTTLEPFQVEFLGEMLSIENNQATTTAAKTTNDVDTITLSVGKKAILNAGESLSVVLAGQTYTVSLKGTTSTGNGKVDLEVTGPAGTQREVIDQDTSLSFSSVGPRPVQVRVEDVFNEEGVVNDRATVIVGTEQSGGTKGSYDARRTYDTNNAYIGEDEDDPIWRWHLGNLTGARPTLGVRLGLSVDGFDEGDNPLVKHTPYVGDYICLPNFYACMVFEKMAESDDDFRWYSFDADSQKDLRSIDNQATPDQTNLNVLKLESSGTTDQGFINSNYGTSFESEALYVAINRSMIGVWREEKSGSDLLPVVINDTAYNNGAARFGIRFMSGFAKVDYGSSQMNLHLVVDMNHTVTSTSAGSNVVEGVIVIDDTNNATDVTRLTTMGSENTEDLFNATTRGFYHSILNDGDLVVYFRNSSETGITYLGHSDGDTTIARDVEYNDAGAMVDISNYEENTRTRSGLLINDPDADNGNDEFKFAIPSDFSDYEAFVRFARPKDGVLSTTGIGGKPTGTTASSSVLMKDTEVTDVTKYNAVVVGGPCVNRVAASLLGLTFPACGEASGLQAGAATLVLKNNGTKKALLAYGWEADDTRRAAVLLKDSLVLNEKLSAAGKSDADSVMVRGTSLEVAGITVA